LNICLTYATSWNISSTSCVFDDTSTVNYVTQSSKTSK